MQALLDDVCELASVHTQVRIRGLDRRIGTLATLEGNPTLLGLAVFNLILAAAVRGRAAPVRVVAKDAPGRVRLEVQDDGPLQPEELRQRILQSDFSQRHEPADLALFAVHTAADAFGGEIEIGRSPLGGNSVSLTLPVPNRAAIPAKNR